MNFISNIFSLSVEQLSFQGFLISIGITYVAGFITAFTPCVYPLIPITIGVMTQDKMSSLVWLKTIVLSSCFVLGMVLVYSSMGLLAGFSGHLFGSFTQKPIFSWFIFIFFVLMGLSLLGLFELKLPFFVNQWLGKQGNGSSTWKAFVVGGVSGLLAAPCAGPMAGAILAYVAHTQNLWFGFVWLFCFGLGLSTPFFVLGILSRVFSKIPKTGPWSQWVKHLAGLMLIVAAYLFLKPFVNANVFAIMVCIGLVLFGIYVPNIFPLESKKWNLFYTVVRLVSLCIAVVVVMIAVIPKTSHDTIHWMTSESLALQKAKEQKKPVIIDFWAQWCSTCHQLDEQTYSDSQVQNILNQNFIAIKIDATEQTQTIIELLKKYEVRILPTIVFLDSTGQKLSQFTQVGFIHADDLIEILNNIL